MRHLILTFSIALIVTTVSAEEGGNLTAKQWTASNTGGQISTVMISPGHDISVDEEVSASVALFGRDGTVYRGKASDDSNLGFEFDRVPAGVYTLVARGPNLVACYALHVVHPSADEAADHRQLIEVSAADIGIGTVRSAVIRYTPSTVEPASKYTAAEAQRMLNAQNNNQLSGVVRSVSDFSGQINQAGLVDGNLVGAAMTNVLVYDDSGMVAQTISDDQGKFTIEQLAPGPYSIIAIGRSGIGVTGIQVVEEQFATNDSNKASATKLVSFQAPAESAGLQMQLAPVGLNSPAIQELLQDRQSNLAGALPADAGLPTPGGYGGGGYGGGGAGGGSGAGGLLGLTAAAIGIAAIDSDDGSSFTAPPVTSPVTP